MHAYLPVPLFLSTSTNRHYAASPLPPPGDTLQCASTRCFATSPRGDGGTDRPCQNNEKRHDTACSRAPLDRRTRVDKSSAHGIAVQGVGIMDARVLRSATALRKTESKPRTAVHRESCPSPYVQIQQNCAQTRKQSWPRETRHHHAHSTINQHFTRVAARCHLVGDLRRAGAGAPCPIRTPRRGTPNVGCDKSTSASKRGKMLAFHTPRLSTPSNFARCGLLARATPPLTRRCLRGLSTRHRRWLPTSRCFRPLGQQRH